MAASQQDQKQIASRYVTALFALAEAEDALEKTQNELERIGELLAESDCFARLCFTPTLSRHAQHDGLKALAEKGKLSLLVGRFLMVLAENRRVSCLPYIISGFAERLRRHRGQAVAEVTSATRLKKAEQDNLAKLLKKYTGKDVVLHVTENSNILGGLRIQVDGKMIDATVAGRLGRLKDRLYTGIRQIA